jgi:hypothetical protein
MQGRIRLRLECESRDHLCGREVWKIVWLGVRIRDSGKRLRAKSGDPPGSMNEGGTDVNIERETSSDMKTGRT